MTPKLESQIRSWTLPLMFLAAVVLVYGSDLLRGEPKVIPEPEPEIEFEWLYVNTNNVLFFWVEEGQCRTERKYSLLQVHEGTKVLVISRQGEWVEVELEDQTKLFTHGCIHETMLEKRHD